MSKYAKRQAHIHEKVVEHDKKFRKLRKKVVPRINKAFAHYVSVRGGLTGPDRDRGDNLVAEAFKQSLKYLAYDLLRQQANWMVSQLMAQLGSTPAGPQRDSIHILKTAILLHLRKIITQQIIILETLDLFAVQLEQMGK